MKAQVVLLSFILLISFLIIRPLIMSSTFAFEPTITYESINPDSELRYKLKRLTEKIESIYINIVKKDQKISYSSKLVQKRFAEYVYIIENDKASYLEVATSRYITHIGLLKEKIRSNSQHPTIKDKFTNHPEVLSVLRDKYPSQTAEWLFVQQAVDTVNVLISELD